MAQFKKEEVRQAILDSARSEFSLYGFRGANLRQIAERADQKPGNIYNYFKNKDELFRAVVAETLDAIETGMMFIRGWSPTAAKPEYSLEDERRTLMAIVDFVHQNRENVRLIVFKGQGSSLENLRDELISESQRVFARIIGEVVRFSAGKYSYVPSEFFFGTLNRYFLDSILEMLRLDKSHDEMQGQTEEMLLFYYNGLLALMKREG